MSPLRLVALLPLVAVAGCYSDAPAQSTLPEPQYFAGPPGGAPDPGSAYGQPPAASAYPRSPSQPAYGPSAGQPADDSADAPADPDDDSAADPSELGPSAAAPAPMAGPVPDQPGAAAPGDDLAEAAPAPDPTAGVTNSEIDATLGGYGQWIDNDDYGQVWRPDATVVGADFTPYESGGSWQQTDVGWAFACDYPWGWLPFHYGRWAWFHDYWGWVPGHRWGPAWVEWRHGGNVVGWRPMRPQIVDHRTGTPGHDHRFGSGPQIRDHRHAEQHDAHWRFATDSDFGRPHVRSHLYGNLAEGLRVTSRVAVPPVRARTTVRAADLMRSRFAASGRPSQPGGASQIRDHRSQGQAYGQGYLPQRYAPYNSSGRATQPTVRDNPAVRGYQAPVRGYQQPGRTYQPPMRTYQQPGRTYQPPGRTYQPPVRSYGPSSRGYSPPVRSYRPPAPSAPPPVRSYSPPSRSPGPPSGSPSGGSSSHSSSGSSSHSSSSSSSSHSSSSGGHHR